MSYAPEQRLRDLSGLVKRCHFAPERSPMMSALGHKRTFAVQKARSAFDPKADTNSVRHGPSMIDSVRPPPNQNMPAPNAAADRLRPSRPEVQFSPGRVHRLDPRQPTPSR